MCHEATGASYDRPIHPDDVAIIAAAYPRVSREDINALYAAMTDHHWPQPAVLIALCEMVDRAQRGDLGYYPYPVMPFSAMDLESYDRVQTDGMYAFHTVFESMALAQRNMVLINEALAMHFNLQLVLFCDCGCGMVPRDCLPFEEEWYQQINALRSLAEAFGTPVVRVHDFWDPQWKSRDLDMGPSETTSYARMYSILQRVPRRVMQIGDLASDRFNTLFPRVTA